VEKFERHQEEVDRRQCGRAGWRFKRPN